MTLIKAATKRLIGSVFLITFSNSTPIFAQQAITGYPDSNQNGGNTNSFWNNNSSNNNSFNPIANAQNNPSASIDLPKNPANFWTSFANASSKNLINTSTVFTGVLQEDISSKKSKAGDIFSIMLPEDYTVNDKILIPKYSKFVGTIVTAAPAGKAKRGNPGNLQISMQTLVSPDGTSVPVNAFIDYNPNDTAKINVSKSRGVPVGEWSKSAVYSLHYAAGGLGSRLGLPFFYKGQTGSGLDFVLIKGELLPVRLTQPLDVTPLIAGNGQSSNKVSGSVPLNLPPTVLPSTAPNNFQIPGQLPLEQINNNMMPEETSPAGPEPF
jgi:hypothetical protein